MRVGFIGLGVMGREMAANIAKAGHEVSVYDVLPAAVAAMSGMRAATDVASCAHDAELVITMLPDTPQVESVILGAGGLLENPPLGKLVIEMSTISPSATRAMASKLAAAGIALLDAPVSGGALGAKEARLSIMAGGERAAFDRA